MYDVDGEKSITNITPRQLKTAIDAGLPAVLRLHTKDDASGLDKILFMPMLSATNDYTGEGFATATFGMYAKNFTFETSDVLISWTDGNIDLPFTYGFSS